MTSLVKISVKSSDIFLTVKAYQQLSKFVTIVHLGLQKQEAYLQKY